MLLFCPSSVPWTGNELAADEVQNCENSQLTLTNLSQLCVPPSASSTQSCDTSYSSSREEMEVASTVQPLWRRTACIKRRFRRWLTKTVSLLWCSGQDYQQKMPVTECLACCVCVLLSTAKSIIRMNSCVRFCCHNILFLRTMCGEGSYRAVF